MKVVITKKLPVDISQALKGFRVEYNESEEAVPIIRLRQMLSDADGLICTLADRIDRTLIDSAPRLRVIANYAVGCDNIDVAYAKQRGIIVCNTPNVLTQSTAELGFALILSVARKVTEGDKLVKSSRFNGWSPNLMLGCELYKKTIGIFGMGNIGCAVAKIASGFSMDVIYHNRSRNEQMELLTSATYASFNELLQWSDFLIITAPLNNETRHRFSLSEFKQMKKNAIIVNIGRGEIIREADLATALKENIIQGAGLDVYEYEPEINDAIKKLDNVVLLPHLGSGTVTARAEMVTLCIDAVKSVLADGVNPKNVINFNI